MTNLKTFSYLVWNPMPLAAFDGMDNLDLKDTCSVLAETPEQAAAIAVRDEAAAGRLATSIKRRLIAVEDSKGVRTRIVVSVKRGPVGGRLFVGAREETNFQRMVSSGVMGELPPRPEFMATLQLRDRGGRVAPKDQSEPKDGG